MKRNCADSWASCARNAAVRAGASIPNSAIAEVRDGKSVARFAAGSAGMMACNCSVVSMAVSIGVGPRQSLNSSVQFFTCAPGGDKRFAEGIADRKVCRFERVTFAHVKRSEDRLSRGPAHTTKRPDLNRSAGVPRYLATASHSSAEAEAHRAADQAMSGSPLAPVAAPARNIRGDHDRGWPGAGSAPEPATQAFMESRFGEDFGDVRTHTGGNAERSAATIVARAYTIGNDICSMPSA